MPHPSRLTRQDGFIREILWVALIIAIAAAVVLDGMSIFGARQSVRDNTATAAKQARTEYAQTLDVTGAQVVAQKFIDKSDLEMLQFTSAKNSDGTAVFTVKAKANATTYVFKYLKVVPPLEKWVERTTHPVASSSSQ